jgi:hypothetical protein
MTQNVVQTMQGSQPGEGMRPSASICGRNGDEMAGEKRKTLLCIVTEPAHRGSPGTCSTLRVRAGLAARLSHG